MPDTGAWGDEWDRVVDVLVVGTGVAGHAAALAALDAGSSVLMLERMPFIGGTTAKSGGAMWIMNNPFMAAAGIADERSKALQYLARCAHPTLYRSTDPTFGMPGDKFRLLEAFYDRGADALRRLIELGALDLMPLDSPDYYAALSEDAAPVGRLLYPMLPAELPRDVTGGQVLIDGMNEVVTSLGGEVLVERRVVHAIVNDEGAVVGVEAQVGRRTELLGARRGVVFCSGGFLHNPEMAHEFLRGPVFGGAAAAGSTGDFVNIGIEVGARLGNMSHAWWSQAVVDLTARTRETIRDVYAPFGDSMVIVDRRGQRVVNEKIPYNERSQVHFHWDPVRGEYPNYLLFMIWDDDVAQDPTPDSIVRFPVPEPPDTYEFVITADTWPELVAGIEARLAELDAATGGFALDPSFATGLADTIERFGAMARAGVDEDFQRGSTPLEKKWAGRRRSGMPNRTMHPFRDTGPYHAVVLGPAALDTKGGPVIDELGRVLGVTGAPIQGLYGAGNCIASPAGQAYWGPGGTVGPALVFGHIAGAAAAEASDHRPPSALVDSAR